MRWYSKYWEAFKAICDPRNAWSDMGMDLWWSSLKILIVSIGMFLFHTAMAMIILVIHILFFITVPLSSLLLSYQLVKSKTALDRWKRLCQEDLSL